MQYLCITYIEVNKGYWLGDTAFYDTSKRNQAQYSTYVYIAYEYVKN